MRKQYKTGSCNTGSLPCERQKGSALIVSLVMLLLITLIGVGAMQTNILQERMSANMHDRDIAFQAAESALRDAEGWVANNIVTITNNNGRYDLNSAARPNYLVDPPVGGASRSYSGNITNAAAQPEYFVESIDTFFPTGTSIGNATTPPPVTFYRITARGVGGSGDSVAVVRSVFRSN